MIMDAKKALNIIAAQCGKKECCSADVAARLRRWELSERDVAAIMEFLVKHRFVDDARFAEAYARNKSRFNRWGRLKIARMLRLKQIPEAVIGQALAAIPEEGEDGHCLELLRQKARLLKETDAYKRKARLYRFAVGRGFDHDTVSRALGLLARDAEE